MRDRGVVLVDHLTRGRRRPGHDHRSLRAQEPPPAGVGVCWSGAAGCAPDAVSARPSWSTYRHSWRRTASSSQVIPRPGPLGATFPSCGSSRSVRTAPAMSRYSSQCAVGVTARTCALGSIERMAGERQRRRLGLPHGAQPARNAADLHDVDHGQIAAPAPRPRWPCRAETTSSRRSAREPVRRPRARADGHAGHRRRTGSSTQARSNSAERRMRSIASGPSRTGCSRPSA